MFTTHRPMTKPLSAKKTNVTTRATRRESLMVASITKASRPDLRSSAAAGLATAWPGYAL
jgi:hypothetical protein